VITSRAAGQLPGQNVVTAAADARGQLVIVTGSGDRVPDCPVFEDRAEAVQARDFANRRAARVGRPAAYQIAPAAGAGRIARPPAASQHTPGSASSVQVDLPTNQ
jgi:hypothetical protein